MARILRSAAWHMPQLSALRLVVAAVLCGSVWIALLRAKAAAPPRQWTLRFAVSNLWVLDHVCRSSGAVLLSGYRPGRIVFDLHELTHLDDSGLASLDYACAHWARAGVPIAGDRVRRRG